MTDLEPRPKRLRTSSVLAVALALLGAEALTARAQEPQAPPPHEDGGAASPSAPTLTPPRVLHGEPPTYPPARQAEAVHPTVVVRVLVGTDGHVTEAEVEHGAGEDFDAAALEAVGRWVFDPARRDGTAVPSRVRVSVHFDPPAPTPEETSDRPHDEPVSDSSEQPADASPAPDATSATPDDAATTGEPASHAHDEPSLFEEESETGEPVYDARAEVELARLRSADRAASDFELDARALSIAPSTDAGQLLSRAPGMFVTRPEGDAIAHRVMLRGFDAEHGQDIEFNVGGVPINQPSHIHGQGYADLGFVIPEVVRRIRLTEGVYDPRQGDFAVAGSADFELGVERRGVVARSQMGSFRTFRTVAVWAPEGHGPSTFAAVQFRRTQGFGENRAGGLASGIVQYAFGDGAWRFRLLGAFHGARSDIAGVVRRDDVASGRVGFYDSYPYPTAQAQSAFSARALLAFTAEHRHADGSNSDITFWLQYNDFHSQQNFTGFTQTSQVNPEWHGRGDLVEQRNQQFSLGLRTTHRTRAYQPSSQVHGHFELGLAARTDLIQQNQGLLAEPQNETWDARIDARITGADVGAFVDTDWELTRYFRVRGGVRADALYYDVNDRLGNFVPAYREPDYLPGYRRTAFGVVVGPRVTLEGRPTDRLSVLLAYGKGYRSPQALTLEDGERAPYTTVQSVDLGARLALGPHEEAHLAASGFFTQLSDDLIFDPADNMFERIGPTRRVGFVAQATYDPFAWLHGSLSVTYVNATLLEPPVATAADPTPPFVPGQNLPYVPPVVIRADLGADHRLATWKDEDLVGRIGAGYSYVGRRPLPYSQKASPISLLDVRGSLTWHGLELGLEIFNLLDTQYAASEYYFVSNWDPSQPPSRIPERTIAAGAPRTFLATLGVSL